MQKYVLRRNEFVEQSYILKSTTTAILIKLRAGEEPVSCSVEKGDVIKCGKEKMLSTIFATQKYFKITGVAQSE